MLLRRNNFLLPVNLSESVKFGRIGYSAGQFSIFCERF